MNIYESRYSLLSYHCIGITRGRGKQTVLDLFYWMKLEVRKKILDFNMIKCE